MRDHIFRTLQAIGLLVLAFGTLSIYVFATLFACGKAAEKPSHR